MEALTISAANLDTIEKNLGAVANELSSVIANVSTVNNQVNKVESKVELLNDEVQNLVKEIRETTIITNARQSIMYNNAQIEKQFGYYDSVRRKTESLLDALENSPINKSSLKDLNQDLLLNNPNYWLANALSSVSYWLLNDHENCQRELNNSLRKDSKKTSLFFCMLNLKLNRTKTSINWLKKYLRLVNPMRLDKDFITVLDLATSGLLGNQAKQIVLDKINTWLELLKNEPSIKNKQKNIWTEYITDQEETYLVLPYLEVNSPDVNIIKNNLIITSSYHNVLNNLQDMTKSTHDNQNIDDIIRKLIYDFEDKEQKYQRDNFRNNLVISCNGDREKAENLFRKQEELYDNEIDILTLLSHLVIYSTDYKISLDTKKIALSLVKDYVIEAYIDKNKKINKDTFNIKINNFATTTKDGRNQEEITSELNNYVESEFINNDKNIIIILLILNILGIVGIFLTLNNHLLCSLLIIILFIGNIFLFLKLNNRTKLNNKSKEILKNNIWNTMEKVLAETIDYLNLLKQDEESYQQLISYLNSLEANNYVKSNNDRNIQLGD